MERKAHPPKKRETAELVPAVTDLITKTIEYTIFRMMLSETVLTVREIADATNYSIREIQNALNTLIKQNLVVKTKLDNTKAPVYHLDRNKIQADAAFSDATESIPVHQ